MDRTLPGSSVHGILHKDTGVGGHALLPGGLPNPGIELSLLRLLHWQEPPAYHVPPAPPGSPRWLLTASRNPSFSLPVIRAWSPTQTLLSRRVTASQCRAGSSCTPRISYESKSGSRSVMSVPATPLAIAHGMLQARTPEWVAFPFSRGSSQPRARTQVSRLGGGFFTSWATREAQDTGVGSLSLLQEIFPTQDRTGVSCIATGFFTNWAIREAIYLLPLALF